MKHFTPSLTLAFTLATLALPASAKEFSYLETFDDDSHFTQSTALPDGWAAADAAEPIKRYKGSWTGNGTHSGDYVLGTLQTTSPGRDEWVFSKMLTLKAGVKYTVKFWLVMPGGVAAPFSNNVAVKAGTAQTAEACTVSLGETGNSKISAWTEQTYEFTPEADGDYCFGLNLTTQLYQSGAISIDDFEVSGNEPDDVPAPDPDKVVNALPYSQSFDNENNDYDGKTEYVPHGWLSTGSYPFRTANIDGVKAKDGTYYVVAPESSIARTDRLYTSFFRLSSDTTYVAEFWLYMPGDGDSKSDFSFTVGEEQDADFHTALLTREAYAAEGWQKVTVNYTPDHTGYYCFSFALGGEAENGGEVAIDLFTLTAPGLISKPRADFGFNGYFSQMNSHLTVIDGQEIQMVNRTADGEKYEWLVPGANPENSDEENPTFSFPNTGTYTIRLKATNAKGESTATQTVDVDVVDEDGMLPLAVFNPSSETLMGRDNIPYYSTAEYADYATGVNHYYTHIAERFNLPEGHTYKITALTTFLCCYGLANRDAETEANKEIRFVLYGEKDGFPDLSHVYSSTKTTFKDCLGTMGLAKAEVRTLTLPEPLTADGPFFLAIEFDSTVVLDDPDANLSRTIVGLGGFTHKSGVSSLYVRPTAVPEGCTFVPDGSYCPVDSIDSELAGLGLNLTAWMSVDKASDAIAYAPDGRVAFSARTEGHTLLVSGTTEGEVLTLTDAAGRTVASAKASAQLSRLSTASLPAGIYVVKGKSGSVKVVVK